jgi:hypothetical protein
MIEPVCGDLSSDDGSGRAVTRALVDQYEMPRLLGCMLARNPILG